MNLYEYWDAFSVECDIFHDYASDHLDDFIMDVEKRKYKKVLSTYGRDLGIASPSKLTKHIVGKYKSGRVIKNLKPSQLYKATYFDSAGFPLAVESYDISSSNSVEIGRSGTRYFVQYGDSVWTAWFSESGSLFNEHFKIVYDDEQRLKGFYKINAGNSLQVMAEEYDYSEIESGIVTCLFTYYVGRLCGSSKDIPIGYKGSPATQQKYIIRIDEKGRYKELTAYKNINGEFVFEKHSVL